MIVGALVDLWHVFSANDRPEVTLVTEIRIAKKFRREYLTGSGRIMGSPPPLASAPCRPQRCSSERSKLNTHPAAWWVSTE